MTAKEYDPDSLLESLSALYEVATRAAANGRIPIRDRLAAVRVAATLVPLLARAHGFEDGEPGWRVAAQRRAVAREHESARALTLTELAARCSLTLDPWQQQLVLERRHTLVLCGRQVGKTTAAAVAAVWEMLSRSTAHVVCVSPSLRQSQELYDRILKIATVVCADEIERQTAVSLRLRSGARCASLPASEHTIRGLSAVTLLLEDEASRVPDELHYAVSPMLATTKGRHVLLTTPWGPRGHFHDLWQRKGAGADEWCRITVKSSECERISAEFLARERERLGARWYAQEYECEFVASEDSVFGDVLQSVVLDGSVEAEPWLV